MGKTAFGSPAAAIPLAVASANKMHDLHTVTTVYLLLAPGRSGSQIAIQFDGHSIGTKLQSAQHLGQQGGRCQSFQATFPPIDDNAQLITHVNRLATTSLVVHRLLKRPKQSHGASTVAKAGCGLQRPLNKRFGLLDRLQWFGSADQCAQQC